MATVGTYTNELKHIGSFIPELVSITGIPNMQQRELIVRFSEVDSTQYPNCQKAMELYCWPTNAKPQRWVENPIIEGGDKHGINRGKWRMVSVTVEKGNTQGLLVTLREGYATTLMWDEAMLADEHWLQLSEQYADVVFPNIDPEHLQKIVDAIPEFTATDITIRGHVYTATAGEPWEYIHVRPEQVQDGSYIIRLFMGQPRYTQVLYDNYGSPDQSKKTYCHNVPKRLAESVVTTYNLVDGASGTSNYSTQEGLVDLVFYQRGTTHITIRNVKTFDGCEYDELTDYWYNYTKDEAEAFTLASVYGAWAKGYEYAIDRLSYSGDGRWTVITSKKHVKRKTHVSAQEWDKDADSTTTNTVKSGQTSIPAIATAKGYVEWVRASVDRFCTWTTQKFRRTSIPGSLTFNLKTARGTITHIKKWNQATIDFGDAGTGFCYELVGFGRNPDDTYNWAVWKVPYLFDTDAAENYWQFRTNKPRDYIIGSGANVGQYQRYEHIWQWRENIKRFSDETAAYAYLRESEFYTSNSRVAQHGINQFTVHKTFLETDFGRQKSGDPFTGA